jgi:protein phosphatase
MLANVIHNEKHAAQLSLTFGGYSAAGNKSENQDAFAVSPNYSVLKGSVAAIADGASCAKYAAKASQLAVMQFIEQYLATPDSWSTKRAASKILNSLNQWLYRRPNGDTGQWITTFSAMVFKSATGYVFHLGDTRISLYREQQLEAITQDHCQNSILTRALGADLRIQVDAHQIVLKDHDIFMFTCDGIHDVLSTAELTQYLNQIPLAPDQKTLEATSQQIVQRALEAGSNDNVTCLLVAIKHVPQQSPAEIVQELCRKAIPPVLKPGMSIDGYTVVKTLHASSRSHLYLVTSKDSNEPEVLKAPSLNFQDDAIYLQGFIREAWVGERLHHPNVMRIKKSSIDSAFLYHIGEYINGQTLAQWMQANPSPDLATVQAICNQIIQALRAFQRLDLVHRDIKPDNIMIDQYGQVKLIDYGCVSVAALDELQQSLTTDVVQGTLNYIAPESLYNNQYSMQSDLFALAVICYEMLCGQLPFKPLTSYNAHQYKQSHWQYIPIKQRRPDLPFWIDLTFQKALQPNPKLRFQAYSEFWQAFQQPDTSVVARYQQQPLLLRDPVKFWQIMTTIMTVLLLISLFY